MTHPSKKIDIYEIDIIPFTISSIIPAMVIGFFLTLGHMLAMLAFGGLLQ